MNDSVCLIKSSKRYFFKHLYIKQQYETKPLPLLLIIALTIAAGLASRYFANQLPCWVNLYLGDMLWALMVFFLFGFIFKRRSTLEITLLALVFSFCIEISQLYHAPWIDTIRATRLGGLILGFGFLWSDLLCYSVGVGIGFCIEKYFLNSLKLLRRLKLKITNASKKLNF